MTINYRNIRAHNGSQAGGFEELCCQLAHAEPADLGSRFRRKGTPDGGVECFWTFPDSREWAWQAKYFHSLDEAQWRQIDESVATALEKHPRLALYTICLPIDLADPRTPGRQSAQERWDVAAKKWAEWAAEKGLSVQFERWGAFEIAQRLTRPEHAGRRWYWFREQELSPAWFSAHIREQVAFAGPRYTPELRVELPIASVFSALANAPEIRRRFRKIGRDLRGLLNAGRIPPSGPQSPNPDRPDVVDLETLLERLADLLGDLTEDAPRPADFEEIRRLRREAYVACRSLIDRLGEAASPPSAPRPSPEYPRHSAERLARIQQSLELLEDLAEEGHAELMARPALLVVGEAGSGKTHLFCDVAERRVAEGLPTLLVLGEQLGPDDPWTQIIRCLGLACSREEFLGAIDAAAEAAGHRAMILIDALNERAEGRWKNQLPTMLEVLADRPRIGIAVSCRTTYEPLVIRDDLVPARLTRVEHRGFAGRLFQATTAFFAHYGIDGPRTPPLSPEFQNPLFLKLFCEGMKRSGRKRPPRGAHGLSWVFATLIDSVNRKLSAPEDLDFDAADRVVHRGLSAIAAAMAEEGEYFLPSDRAGSILDGILSREGHSQSLLGKLISEGLLARDIYRGDVEEGRISVIRFAYERFADFQIAGRILDRYLDRVDPASSFAEGTPLGDNLRHPGLARGYRGLLAALCSLVPERTGRELIELVAAGDGEPLHEAFLESLPWRAAGDIQGAATAYVGDQLGIGVPGRFEEALRWPYRADRVIDAALSACAEAGHPLNAEWLHRWLSSLSMPDRDAIWSTFLHRQHGQGRSVERILEWSWPVDVEGTDAHADIADDAIRLVALTLGWFLTTPDRFIRDRATKALVALLHRRLHLLVDLLDAFEGVDDPYVRERVHAVAYGCVLRSRDVVRVAAIADRVNRGIFAGGDPYPHILLRDYARNIVEYALHLGCDFEVDPGRIRPPYSNAHPWPLEAPTGEEYDRLCKQEGFDAFALSLGELGDFRTYILHCDSRAGIHEYRSSPPAPGATDRGAASECPPRLAKAILESLRRISFRVGPEDDTTESNQASPTDDWTTDVFDDLTEEEQAWLASRYDTAEGDSREIDGGDLDPTLAPRWILQRVIELGWSPGRFADFDRSVNRHDARRPGKPERIGKKYQWIALNELYARVLDHCPYRVGGLAGIATTYDGPWDLGCRDIDPSSLARGQSDASRNPVTRTWWFPVPSPFDQADTRDDRDWVRDPGQLPDLGRYLEVRRPPDRTRWWCLSASGSWTEDRPPSEDEGIGSRRVGFFCDSYLVRKIDLDRLLRWLATRVDHQGGSMCHLPDGLFPAEYAWAPSFSELREDAATGWEGLEAGGDHQFAPVIREWPVPLVVTAMTYTGHVSGFDCSGSEGIRGELPSSWLGYRLGLRWDRKYLRYEDPCGRVVAFDPSAEEPGPSALLVNPDALHDFLAANGLSLFWYVYAEKSAIVDREEESAGLLTSVRCYVLDDSNAIVSRRHLIVHRQPGGGRTIIHDA